MIEADARLSELRLLTTKFLGVQGNTMAAETVTAKKTTVKRTVRFKLLGISAVDHERLTETGRQYITAFNAVSEAGWAERRTNMTELHKKTYYPLRERLALPSQLVISARCKAVEALKSAKPLKGSQPVMKHPSIRYDARTYKLDWKAKTIALTAIGGARIETGFKLDKHSKKFRGLKVCSADLVKKRCGWFLHIVVEKEVKDAVPTGKVIGVDRGVNRPAVTSEGQFLGSRKWRDHEHKLLSLRRRLQAKGTKSAKRHLDRLNNRLFRFRNDCDHVLSKRMVQSAKPGDTLVFEDLAHIRIRVKTRGRSNRRRLHSWSFHRLGAMVEYKARLKGVLVGFVDPRDTSRRCPECGWIDKKNRADQAHFRCVKCKYSRNADLVAGWNIRDRYKGLWSPVSRVPGRVNDPNVNTHSYSQAPHFSAG